MTDPTRKVLQRPVAPYFSIPINFSRKLVWSRLTAFRSSPKSLNITFITPGTLSCLRISRANGTERKLRIHTMTREPRIQHGNWRFADTRVRHVHHIHSMKHLIRKRIHSLEQVSLMRTHTELCGSDRVYRIHTHVVLCRRDLRNAVCFIDTHCPRQVLLMKHTPSLS